MKNIRAILVDDECNAITNLTKLLGIYCPSISIVDTATRAEIAAYKINSLKPDVVFLDIAMPSKNGFELLQLLYYMPLVVFVTAHEKYALNAIKASAVDFLLKPIDVAELKKVEEKLTRIIALKPGVNGENYAAVVGNLINMMQNPGIINKITLTDAHGYKIISLEDVLYLEGDDNYTSFYLSQRKKIVVSKTLKEYESFLRDHGFFRIHKSSIINLLHLKEIINDGTTSAVMSNEQILPISRRRIPELVERVKKFL